MSILMWGVIGHRKISPTVKSKAPTPVERTPCPEIELLSTNLDLVLTLKASTTY
jgi:hypothetical protein